MKPVSAPSATEWLARLGNGDISSVELVRQTLSGIDKADKKLNAVVAIYPETSIRQAQAADVQRRKGVDLPLLGLPITVKDSIDVAGFPCTGGSFAREQFRPDEDASVVARLRAAGAIVIAKTNVPEYSSSYETDNAIFGCTNNPFDTQRTAGGSTGGEGALLGADASLVGIGLDGGGSIRVPSHYCGIYGIRPTTGRTPDTGTWPSTRDTGYRDLMCIGPMARYAEDLSLILPIISGPDWIDPYAMPAPLFSPGKVKISELRIGFYTHDGVAKVSPETEQTVTRVAQRLEQAGARVSEAAMPEVSDATEIFFSLAGADGGVRTLKDLGGADDRHHVQFKTLLDGFGESGSLPDFFDLQERLFAFRARLRRFMNDYDLIIAPVTTGPAPRHMETPYGIPQDEYFLYRGFNYVHTFALAGLPVAVAPAGLQDGLPLGVQLAAQPFREDVALAAAAYLQEVLN